MPNRIWKKTANDAGTHYIATKTMDWLILCPRGKQALTCRRINAIYSYSIVPRVAKNLIEAHKNSVVYYERLKIIPNNILKFIYALQYDHQFREYANLILPIKFNVVMEWDNRKNIGGKK